MAIAIFDKMNDQQTRKGQKLGISSFEAWGARFIMACAACVGAYHIGNVLTIEALSDNPNTFMLCAVFTIGFGLAFAETLTSKSVFTKERPKGAKRDSVGRAKLLLILVVASGVGGYSYHLNTERDQIKTDSHSTYQDSFEDDAATLLSDRNAARAIATTRAERSTANANYSRGMSKLRKEKSKHQAKKPVVVGETMKWFKTFGYALFSLFVSSLLISCSRYLCEYYRPLIAFPFVGFEDKENESWKLEKAHGSSVEIDLTSSKQIKVDNSLPSPPPIELSTIDRNNPTQNRPEPDSANVGAVSGGTNEASGRPLNNDPERAVKYAYSAGHYEAIKQAIIERKITPAQKPVMRQLIALNVKLSDDAARTKKAIEILANLEDEGVIIDNPKFGQSGGKVVGKYILNPDYPMEEASEGIGEFDIVTRCPQCNDYTVTDIVVLIEEQKQITRCDCGHNYVAKTHMESGFNPPTDALLNRAKEGREAGH